MNKIRGDVSDSLTFIVVLFFLAVSLLVSMFAVTQLKHVVTDTSLNETTVADDAVRGMDNITDGGVNKLYGFMVVVLILSMILSAFLVYVHPAFFVLYIITFAMNVIAVPPLANTYQLLYENPVFSEVAPQQTTFVYIMQHLGLIALCSFALSVIVLLGKLFINKGGGGYNADTI